MTESEEHYEITDEKIQQFAKKINYTSGPTLFENENIAVLDVFLNSQYWAEFLAAYDDLTKKGFKLMSVQEGNITIKSEGVPITNQIFFFQKL